MNVDTARHKQLANPRLSSHRPGFAVTAEFRWIIVELPPYNTRGGVGNTLNFTLDYYHRIEMKVGSWVLIYSKALAIEECVIASASTPHRLNADLRAVGHCYIAMYEHFQRGLL